MRVVCFRLGLGLTLRQRLTLGLLNHLLALPLPLLRLRALALLRIDKCLPVGRLRMGARLGLRLALRHGLHVGPLFLLRTRVGLDLRPALCLGERHGLQLLLLLRVRLALLLTPGEGLLLVCHRLLLRRVLDLRA